MVYEAVFIRLLRCLRCSCFLFLQTENSPRQYRGIFHALSTVFREEGPRALYKGWLPSVIGVVSEVFVCFFFLYIPTNVENFPSIF